MGNLKELRGYLRGRREVVGALEGDLCALQEKYEQFFQEVSQVREQELQQLTGHILADRAALPEGFRVALDKAEVAVARELDGKLKLLKAELATQHKRAEQLRQRSLRLEAALRKQNLELDQQEEQLKARNEDLLARVAAYNAQVAQLGRGWGFFANFFRLRALAAEREALAQQQQDLAARIEQLRQQWAAAAGQHQEEEQALQQRWREQHLAAGLLQAKLDALQATEAALRRRSVIERVLYDLAPDRRPGRAGDPLCPRCASPNPPENRFCQSCARRLGADRPDFAGSVEEMAELNLHHERFSQGMKACQEIIGLVRGLGAGIDAFSESVDKVLRTQRKHSLRELEIDVPAESLAYGRRFDALRAELPAGRTLHPVDFARQVRGVLDEVLTEAKIKAYFEAMGKELSRQADRQW